MSLADLTAQIADLNQSFERDLAKRVHVFENADLETIGREAHKLRGSFPQQERLTKLAARVEELAVGGNEDAARRAALVLCEEAQRISQRASAQPEPPPKLLTISQGPVFRVLVVDDDDAIRHLSVISLARLGGHTVRGAEDTENVLEQAIAGLYDLIIADAMMPRAGGVELALRLREQAVDVPIVVLSAASPEELGATGHGLTWWRKPISPHELVRRVAELLS